MGEAQTVYWGDDYTGSRALQFLIADWNGESLNNGLAVLRLMRRPKFEGDETTGILDVEGSLSQTGSDVTFTVDLLGVQTQELESVPPKSAGAYQYQIVTARAGSGAPLTVLLAEGPFTIRKAIRPVTLEPIEYDPTRYENLTAWYNADDPDSVTTVGPFAPYILTEWRNQLGFPHLDQPDWQQAPYYFENYINGRNAVAFPHLNQSARLLGGQLLNYVAADAFTLFIVFRPVSNWLHVPSTGIVQDVAQNVALMYAQDDRLRAQVQADSVGQADLSIPFSSPPVQMATVLFGGGSLYFELNGVGITEQVAGNIVDGTQIIWVGGSDQGAELRAYIGEILFYARRLDVQEVLELQAGLIERWAVGT